MSRKRIKRERSSKIYPGRVVGLRSYEAVCPVIMETSVGVFSASATPKQLGPQTYKLPRDAEHDAAIDALGSRNSARIHSSWPVAAPSATGRWTPATSMTELWKARS